MLHVIYGGTPRAMAKEILAALKPEEGLRKNALIGLKPNLILAKPANSGATTSPEIVAGIIEYFQERGFKNLLILESSWVGDSTKKAFEVCGYEKLSRDYRVPLQDLKKDTAIKSEAGGLAIKVCRQALEVDFLINIPVLKAHCQTRLTCALKNLKGVIPDREKRRFHSLGLHKPIAVLNKVVKTGLVVVDAIMGDLTYEEGGNPVEMGRIIASTDPVLVDAYAAGLLGLSPEDVPYITCAAELGVGKLYTEDTLVVEHRKEDYLPITLTPSPRVKQLARFVTEKSACSPCYGAVIHALSRLEEENLLNDISADLHIGRDYREKELPYLGVGECTASFSDYIPGCPPRARDIIEHLKKRLEQN